MSIRLNSWEPATEVVAIDDLIPHDATLGFRFVREADKPGVSWDDDIATIPEMGRAAWFTDSEGNIMCIDDVAVG